MDELQVTARLRIHEGALETFLTVAQACVESVRDKDKGTLQYDWFLNADRTECVVHERYVNSDAVLEHMGNLGDTLGALLDAADMSLEVCGSPSEELAAASEGMDIKVYSLFQAP
jgi:quinol monooxygenase YgiN